MLEESHYHYIDTLERAGLSLKQAIGHYSTVDQIITAQLDLDPAIGMSLREYAELRDTHLALLKDDGFLDGQAKTLTKVTEVMVKRELAAQYNLSLTHKFQVLCRAVDAWPSDGRA